MAGYKGHIAGSLLFCGLLYLFPFWQPLSLTGKTICVLLAVFFGLWPDVDTKSKGQYLFLLCVLIADVVLIYREDYKRAAYLGLLIILPIMARHRGWTHSAPAMILVPFGLYLAAFQYYQGSPLDLLPYFLASLLGYASHLVLDRFKF
ncbi:MAG: metal-dependent hydrolase [Candidatus Omnitrophica bacterium]|nr:metal-dependent hydrolase [Candidatus Omnitrophota bacterium]